MYLSHGTKDWLHMVCNLNPMGKNVHHMIPEPKFHVSYDRDIVVMAADIATQSFQIISMEGTDTRTDSNTRLGREDNVYLYDSIITQWRELCKVPQKHRAYSSIFLKGIFYTLFLTLPCYPGCSKLYSCDLKLAHGAISMLPYLQCPLMIHMIDHSWW